MALTDQNVPLLVSDEEVPSTPSSGRSPSKLRDWRLKLWRSANIRDPLYAGHVINFIAMVLYTFFDFARAFDAANPLLLSVSFIILGFAYVVDSVLYLQSWGAEWPTGVALWGELLNIGGSCIYAATSIMYLYQSQVEADSDSVFILESIATVIFFVDAVLYLMAWYKDNDRCLKNGCPDPRDLNLWGNLLNIAPAIIYMIASCNGLALHFSSRDSLVGAVYHGNSTLASGSGFVYGGGIYSFGEWRPERPAAIMRAMAKVYVWGDLLWTIDAAILLVAWAQDVSCAEDEEDADVDQIGIASDGDEK